MAIAEGLRWVGGSKGVQEGEGPTEAKRVEGATGAAKNTDFREPFAEPSVSPEGSNGGWRGSKLKKKKVEGTGKEGDERDDP